MEFMAILLAILFATVVLVSVGDRWNLPWPVLLTIAAGLVVFVPWVPEIHLDAELILPIFLPPLLWALGSRASWQMFRTHWRAIIIYSVLLVVLTILAVVWTVMVFVPGITVAAAVAIGAAVAPPDPVAVEAVAEPVGIPRRLVATLQTEGLFNDAVSLVAFQAALAAITINKDLTAGVLALEFLYTAVAAVVVGLVCGWLGAETRRRLTDTVGRSAVTLIIPFTVYIVAEEIHASGVIAVVVAAVQVSSSKGDLEAEDRLTGAAFWGVIEMLLTGLAFGLMGLQLRQVIDEAGDELGQMIWHGSLVAGVVILVRLVYMSVIALIARLRPAAALTPHSAGEALTMTWAGMRGLVTLALALSLPEDGFPWHAEILVIAVTVLLFTMVVPGLTLPWLVRVLHLQDGDHGDRQERRLLQRAQEAALEEIARQAQHAPPEVVASVSDYYRRMVPKPPVEGENPEDYQHQLEELRRRREISQEVRDIALAAAQNEVLRARRDRGVDPETVDRVLRQLDQMSHVNSPGLTALIPVTKAATGAIPQDRH